LTQLGVRRGFIHWGRRRILVLVDLDWLIVYLVLVDAAPSLVLNGILEIDIYRHSSLRSELNGV
jgi:hypothetical protein